MAAKTAAGVLQELAVKAGTTPKYECVAQMGPQHLSLFEFHCHVFGLKGTGVARSKKIAKQECAQALLLKMVKAGHRVPAPFCLPGTSAPVANDYRNMKEAGLKAAEDGARGIKREGGAGANEAPKKRNKKAFVKYGKDGPPQGVLGTALKQLPNSSGTAPFPIDEMKASCSTTVTSSKTATSCKEQEPTAGCSKDVAKKIVTEPEKIKKDYMEELSLVRCVAANHIAEHMFNTKFGKLVLLVRHWQTRVVNIQTSCQVCGLKYEYHCDPMTNVCTMLIEGKMVAQAWGATKKQGKEAVENLAWEVLINEAISILVKERFIPQDGARISFPEVSGCQQPEPTEDVFGAPVEASMAARMMRMMGWQGGGLGANAQGIAEPVKPHLQIINRAGLGSATDGIHQIKTAAESVMRRYASSDCLDVDLVFSSDFTAVEREAIHHIAGKVGLHSRSYGKNTERFLVVREKINVFDLAHAVVKRGGRTPKFMIFIPAKIASFYRERE